MSLRPADTFLPWDVAEFERLAEVRMPHRISIRRPVPTSDGSGGWTDVPTEVATVPCALTRMREPREITVGEAVAGLADYRMLVPNGFCIQPHDDVLLWWQWRVSLGLPTAGTFTLTYGSGTTVALAYNATAAAVTAALAGISGIGTGNVVAIGADGGPFHIQFRGAKADNEAALTASFTGLTDASGVIERVALAVIGVEDIATDQPQTTVYLTRRV